MAKILISTVYGPDPVLLACTKISPNKLILLVTEKQDSTIKNSLNLIKNSLGRVLDVEIVKIHEYNIIEIAERVVKIIDEIDFENEIIINITSGRKTQSMGVLFGAFARNTHIKKIAYYPDGEGKGTAIYLPVLSMKLSESKTKLLDSIYSKKIQSYKSLSEETGLSSAMVYRAIDELLKEGLVEKTKDEGIILTDAGRIARL